MNHNLEIHVDCHIPNCQICDGGLKYCKVCTAFEGELPSECPGRKITVAEKEKIYYRQIDFVGGDWKSLHNEKMVDVHCPNCHTDFIHKAEKEFFCQSGCGALFTLTQMEDPTGKVGYDKMYMLFKIDKEKILDVNLKKQLEEQVKQGEDWNVDVLDDKTITTVRPNVRLTKKIDDIICTRISCGGDARGHYLVYRGKLGDVKKILENLLVAVKEELLKFN